MPQKKQTLWETIPKKNIYFNCKVGHDFETNPNNREVRSPLLYTSAFLGNSS